MNKSTRIFLGALKISISGGLIAWLLRDVEFAEILKAVVRANPYILFAAFALFFVGYLITATRWRMLLRVQGGDAPLSRLVRSFMVAVFFNNFLPSTIGGDAVRVYDTWKLGVSRSSALSIIFVDRFLGLLALSVITLVAVFFAGTITRNIPFLYAWVMAGAAGLSVLAYLIFGGTTLLPERFLRSSPDEVAAPLRVVMKIISAFTVYRGRQSVLARALGLSFALHANVIVHYILIAHAMGLPLPSASLFLVVPIATVVMMLPVSVNGIGIREGIFTFLLGFYGVSAAQSIAFAWIAYGFILLQGLMGGVVFALRR